MSEWRSPHHDPPYKQVTVQVARKYRTGAPVAEARQFTPTKLAPYHEQVQQWVEVVHCINRVVMPKPTRNSGAS